MSSLRHGSTADPPLPSDQTQEKSERVLQLEYLDFRNMNAEEIAQTKAEELMHIDDVQAAQLQRQLAANRQGGWKPITPEEKRVDRRLNMKFDLMVLPLLALGYMFNTLDKTNLGNAETAGFSQDIGVPSSAVNDASSLFYATYIPVQPITTAISRKVGAPRFIGGCLIIWGILTICHAFVKNDAQLLAIRLLMGLSEAGFYPTVLAYMSDFYPRYNIAFRFSLFYGMMAVAGSFGGLIAFGVLQIKSNLHGWQYLFIIEGAFPVLLGVIAPFLLADKVQNAWYLNHDERAFAARRMVIDSAANLGGQKKLTRRDFTEAFLDWRVWTTMLGNLLASLSSQGFSVFFPVVVKSLGYESGATANLMTVPPYVGGAIFVWIFAWLSDKFHNRTYFLLGGMSIAILGFILTIVIPESNLSGRYGAMVVLQAGAFIHAPLAVAWLSGNTPEPGKRSVALGISGYANLAGIIGPQLFLAKYGPDYHLPLTVTTILLAVGWLVFAGTSLGLRLINRSRARKLAQMTPEDIEEENRSDKRVGDKKWTFVYGL